MSFNAFFASSLLLTHWNHGEVVLSMYSKKAYNGVQNDSSLHRLTACFIIIGSGHAESYSHFFHFPNSASSSVTREDSSNYFYLLKYFCLLEIFSDIYGIVEAALPPSWYCHMIFNGSKKFFDVYELLGQVFSFGETEEFWKHQDIKIVRIGPINCQESKYFQRFHSLVGKLQTFIGIWIFLA